MEYLRFADGIARGRREAVAAERHSELLDYVFKAALVAAGTYEEKVLFEERFVVHNLGDELSSDLPTNRDDSDTEFDYSATEWKTPTEDEMAILERMLQDKGVTVSGGPEAPVNELPPPREVSITDVEQDREWT